MATQLFTIAVYAGETSLFLQKLLHTNQQNQDKKAIDLLCDHLNANILGPETLYYSQWVDSWSTGYYLPENNRYQGHIQNVYLLSEASTIACAEKIVPQFKENIWLTNRLNEAAKCWSYVFPDQITIIIRKVISASRDDEEILSELCNVPSWLTEIEKR